MLDSIKPTTPKAGAWVLLLFLPLEFLLFDKVGAHHHTWIFPRWNDQIQYLTECYTGFEIARAQGFFHGLWNSLINPAAQGTLHDFFAILVFSVVGASRSAALSLNMLVFIAWQISLFRLTAVQARSIPLAWAAIGLTLCVWTPWSSAPGSATDFRLDWMAACTFGIALVAAIKTDRFRSPGWSIIFGVAVAYALLTRFLTGTFFLLIYLIFLGWTLGSESGRWRRAFNLILSAIIAAALAGPVMWLNREWVYNYYLIGHFTGPESAIRSPHMGLGRSIDWLVTHFTRDHLGPVFFWTTGLVSVAMLYFWLQHQRRGGGRTAAIAKAYEGFVPAFAFLISPALVLALHQQKSEVVLSIMLGGAVTLIIVWWCKLAPALSPRKLCIIAAITLVTGCAFFVQKMVREPLSPTFQTDARKVLALSDYIYEHAKKAGLEQPKIGVDRVTDCLDGQVLRVICYERKKTWVPFIMTLPTGITEERDTLLMERLAESDFVFLSEGGVEGGWPYDREMQALRPRLSAWCEQNLKLVEHFEIFDYRMVLYQRREIP